MRAITRWKSVALVTAAAFLLAGCAPVTLAADVSPAPTIAGSPAATAVPTPTPSQTPTPTPTPTIDPAVAHCANVHPGVKHIFVNIHAQHLWACNGTKLSFDSAVTTGASGLTNVHDATPKGSFRINGKYRNVHLRGSDANGSWDDAVAYWIPYIGGLYGFHDASWQKFKFGSELYKTQGSHGCVHLPVSVIAHVFNWAPIGTEVTIS
jgi:lipoprotein-anchoring transpeptidase ErfK/SrfK